MVQNSTRLLSGETGVAGVPAGCSAGGRPGVERAAEGDSISAGALRSVRGKTRK
jgi:hypothetical protein